MGALYETYAENSSFILNSANYSSGVMLGGQAINCNFSSNSANSFGCGEFYAIGCKFFNNSAKSRVGVLHGMQLIVYSILIMQ